MKFFNKEKSTIVVAILLILFIKFFNTDFIKKLSNINYDAYQSTFEQPFNLQDIKIIDIDDKSISEIGQFPWRRDKLAKLLNNLTEDNPKVIAFDIFFSEMDRENPVKILSELNIPTKDFMDSDEIFSKAIENGKVVLPIVGGNQETNKKLNKNLKARFIIAGQEAKNYIYSYRSGLMSLDQFNNVAKGIGTISILESEDGTLRSVPLLINIQNQIWPSLTLELIRVMNNEKNYLIESDELGIKKIKTKSTNFLTDENALIHIKYKKFNSKNYISAVDIINKNYNPKDVENKILIIGSSAAGLYDLVKIPSGRTVPGAQVHANILDNILTNDAIKINSLTKVIEIIFLITSLICLSIIPNIFKPKYSIIFFTIFIVSILGLSIAFYQFNYFIDISYTLISAIIIFTISLYFRFIKENQLAQENEKKQLILKQERETAGEVQKKLFPSAKENNKFIHAKNVPARDVSGDYFDYLKINENEIYFTLADVSGKGVKAGMLMANASAVFRSMARLEKSVSTIAQFVNNQVQESSYKGMFITAIIGKLNINQNTIEYINHGHESMMIIDKDFNFEYKKASLPPLGLMKIKSDETIKTSKINILDKTILIYTDGVTEGYLENGEELRVTGLENEIKKIDSLDPKNIIDHVCSILTKSNKKLRDDITCLGIKI